MFNLGILFIHVPTFGYIRGRRGPPVPPGKNADNVTAWCPNGVLDMFRKNEECTFYFNTEKDGILFNGSRPIGLKDQYGKPMLFA